MMFIRILIKAAHHKLSGYSLLLFYLLFIPSLAFSQAQAQNKNVLVLNSYSEGYVWIDRIMEGVHSVFDGREGIELHINYFDTKRISDETHFKNMFRLLQHKYAKVKIDVILSTDDHALNFLLKHRDELFPGVPLVFNGINDFQPERIAGQKNITGVAETYNARGTIQLMLKMHPKAQKIHIVTDETHSGKDFRRLIRNAEPEFVDRVSFNYLTNYRSKNYSIR